jgi:hypothetical protein
MSIDNHNMSVEHHLKKYVGSDNDVTLYENEISKIREKRNKLFKFVDEFLRHFYSK